MPLEMKENLLTYWTITGRGHQNVLLLHCTMGYSGAWKALIENLPCDRRFLAFDLPGHGKSEPWLDQGDFHTISTNIAKSFLKHPTDLIGHSYGGTIAVRLALEVPEMVRSMVLIEPVLLNLAFRDDPSLKTKYEKEHRAFEDAWRLGDFEGAAQAFSKHWGDGSKWRDLPRRVKDLMIQKIPMIKAGEHNVVGDHYGFSELGRLSSIQIPVLLMEGTKTHNSIPATNSSIQRRLKDTSRVIVEGAGHMLPITHPKKTAEAIKSFWRSI